MPDASSTSSGRIAAATSKSAPSRSALSPSDGTASQKASSTLRSTDSAGGCPSLHSIITAPSKRSVVAIQASPISPKVSRPSRQTFHTVRTPAGASTSTLCGLRSLHSTTSVALASLTKSPLW